jgi:hypothetical protein
MLSLESRNLSVCMCIKGNAMEALFGLILCVSRGKLKKIFLKVLQHSVTIIAVVEKYTVVSPSRIISSGKRSFVWFCSVQFRHDYFSVVVVT